MTRQYYWALFLCAILLFAHPVHGSGAGKTFGFEQLVHSSQRIVHGIMLGPKNGMMSFEVKGKTVSLPLGFRHTDGYVYTAYRMQVQTCLLDKLGQCPIGEIEIWMPGGYFWDPSITDEPLYSGSTGPANYPLPETGQEAVLYLTKRSAGAFQPINDRIRPYRRSCRKARCDPGRARFSNRCGPDDAYRPAVT